MFVWYIWKECIYKTETWESIGSTLMSLSTKIRIWGRWRNYLNSFKIGNCHQNKLLKSLLKFMRSFHKTLSMIFIKPESLNWILLTCLTSDCHQFHCALISWLCYDYRKLTPTSVESWMFSQRDCYFWVSELETFVMVGHLGLMISRNV